MCHWIYTGEKGCVAAEYCGVEFEFYYDII